MSIMHVTSTLTAPLGGAESYCVELAISQATRYNVSVTTSRVDHATKARLESCGVSVYVADVWRPYSADSHGPTYLHKLIFHLLDTIQTVVPARALRRSTISAADVVHVHRFQGFGASVLRGKAGQAVVHTVHDYSLVDTRGNAMRGTKRLERPNWFQRMRARVLARSASRAQRLLFPTERTFQRHVELGLDARLVKLSEVMPLGWRLPDEADKRGRDAGSSRKLSTTKPYFLYLGKLTEHKGVDKLLEAWGDGIKDYRLVLAGSGPLSPLVRSRRRFRVEAHEWVDGPEKTLLLRQAAALVVPSIWPENFPLVVAEATLAGVPVIGNVDSVGPLIEHRRNGLIASNNSASNLRELLEVFSEQGHLQGSLARGSRRRAGQLDMEVHVDSLAHLYERYVEARGGA